MEPLSAAVRRWPRFPFDLTGQVLYWASDASAYTAGSVVNVDGGYLLV